MNIEMNSNQERPEIEPAPPTPSIPTVLPEIKPAPDINQPEVPLPEITPAHPNPEITPVREA
jgi:hypothetical protein